MLKSQYFLAVVVLALCLSVITLATPASCESNLPAVGIVAPTNGSTISGTQVEITVAFVSDGNYPVSKLRVFLDGQTVTERIFEAPSARGNSSFRWDTTRTPNGRHQIDVQAFSQNGDYLGMATCVVTVDNKPQDLAAPKVSIINPKEGEIVSGVKTISVSATDDSGIDPLVSIFVDDSFKSVSNTKPYTYDWDTTKQENGPHIISVKASDDASNQGAAKPVKVIVRNQVSASTAAQTTSEEVAVIASVPTKQTDAPQKVAVTATPVENNVKVTESARTAETQPAPAAPQKFEVAQTTAPKPAPAQSAKIAVQAATPVPAPVPAAPAKTTQVAKVTPAPAAPAKTPTPVQETVATPKPASVAATPAVPAKPVTVAKVDTTPAPVKTEPAAQTVTQTKTPAPAISAKDTAPKIIVKEAVTPKPAPAAVATVTPKPVTVAKEPAAPKAVVVVKEPAKPVVQTKVTPAKAPEAAKPAPVAKPVAAAKPAPVVKPVPVVKPAPVIVRNAAPAKAVKVAKAEVKTSAAPKTVAEVPAKPQTSANSEGIKDSAYIVKSGDSVSEIAMVFGVSIDSLVALNNIEDPNVLQVGDKIVLPADAKMIRIRSVVENVGGTIEWNPKARTVRAICDQNEIKVKIGSRNALVNNQQVKMERPAKIYSGRTVVPTAFVKDVVE